MSLTLRKDSKWWYGKFPEGSNFVVKNLNVKIAGERPATLHEQGDLAFENSRAVAQKKHDEILEASVNKRAGIKFAKNLLEIVSAEKHESPLIANFADTWCKDKKLRQVKMGDKIVYEGQISASYIRHTRGALNRFTRFMATKFSKVRDLASVAPEHIEAYMQLVESYNLKPRAYNAYITLLREMFNKHEPGGRAARALMEMEFKKGESKHRRPFSEAELLKILEAAKTDPEVEPLFILGVNTPLRLGDCCRLAWDTANLDTRFLRIKTSKTGKGVYIPIWGQLYDMLKARPRNGALIFPEWSAMYEKNPVLVNERAIAIFRKAGIPTPIRKPKTRKRFKVGHWTPAPRQVNDAAFHAFRTTWITRALTGCGGESTPPHHDKRPGRINFRPGSLRESARSSSREQVLCLTKQSVSFCALVS